MTQTQLLFEQSPLRVLSLRQPWAFALLNGKNVENRKWSTSYRGRFLIHAAGSMTRREYADAAAFCAARGLSLPPPEKLAYGGLVGSAVLSDVLPRATAAEEHHDSWRMAGQYGFVISDARALPAFIPCPGSLNFFSVPIAAFSRLPAEFREAATEVRA